MQVHGMFHERNSNGPERFDFPFRDVAKINHVVFRYGSLEVDATIFYEVRCGAGIDHKSNISA